MNTELTFNSTNADVPQNVTIFILDDLLLEDSEYFNVTLTRANSSTDSFTVIIEDDDSKLNCCYSSCVYINTLSVFMYARSAQYHFIFFPHIQGLQLGSTVQDGIM